MRKQSGIPGGKIIYSDVKMWGKPLEKPLFDGSIGLVGKPDYLIEQNGLVIPVEVKSCRPPEAPYDLHIFQLAAYCLLVEKVYQNPSPVWSHPLPGADIFHRFHAGPPRKDTLPGQRDASKGKILEYSAEP